MKAATDVLLAAFLLATIAVDAGIVVSKQGILRRVPSHGGGPHEKPCHCAPQPPVCVPPHGGPPHGGPPTGGPPHGGPPHGRPPHGRPPTGGPPTGEPTTEESTTWEPTTGEPTTWEPTTGEPTTWEPTTWETTTGEQTTGEPTTGEQTTGEPTTWEPTTGEQTTGETTNGEPTTGEQTTGEPTTGEQTTGEPTTWEPTTGEQTTGETTTGEQTTGEPTTGEPTTGKPTTWESTTWEPTTEEPSTGGPPPESENPQGVVVTGDCSFRVNGDLSDPAPLFTPHGKLDWLEPNPAGVVVIKNGESIDMYCNASFVAPFANATKVTAQCLQGQYFLVNGTIYPFANFSCTDWPTYTARRTGRSCNGGTDLLEVGFVVSGGFLPTMDICHDEINEVTRYVHHVLTPSSAAYQHSVARPRFIEGEFYGGKNVDQLYTKVQQNHTFSDILGMDASPYFNDSINVYMARGHMAAKVDFIFGGPQKSTFYFVNVAPQWQVFNAGNWERVEDGVRKYVAAEALTTDCYTGTWGVSTLPDVDGVQQPLYLAFDENNNGLIPVPMIYFRVVIDRATGKGIVLVGVNNPHASLEQILADYVICEDIGDRIDWINWAKEDLLKGYSYACSVPDFTAVVKDLPLEALNTTGILGVEQPELQWA